MELSNAPIKEVVIGAQFNGRLINYECIYQFYNLIKDKFPTIKENPILPAIIEKLDIPSETKILPGFNSRKFFINENGSKLIQLQGDRLLFNWKKTNSDEEYPHFDSVYKEFNSVLQEVNKICKIIDKINQVEVTYLDHVPLSDFEKKSFNPLNIFNLINIKEEDELKHLKLELGYPISDLNGVLNINLNSATKSNNTEKIFVLESTCRGALGKKDLDTWFKNAHQILLQSFRNIITENAKNKWGFKND